jgi:hypothetical protein
MKNKIIKYFESVGIGQFLMFGVLEYRIFVLIVCLINLLNIFTNQEQVTFIVTLFASMIIYLAISAKTILKVFQNKEVNDIMTSIVFIMYLAFSSYIIITYVEFFKES